MHFRNREQAAEKLAKALSEYKNKQVVVYALPRGGVVLGSIIAKYLNAPFDLLIPRKIGHPSMSEYAIAAVTESGDIVENTEEIESIDRSWFKKEVENQRKEAKRRREKYLTGQMSVDVSNKTAIIVDDGIATGLTMKAAIADVKRFKPSKIIIAVPVVPRDTKKTLKKLLIKLSRLTLRSYLLDQSAHTMIRLIKLVMKKLLRL